MTRAKRRRDAAVAAENAAWSALRAHNGAHCEACDFGSTMCDAAERLYAAWNEAKRRRMVAEALALEVPDAPLVLPRGSKCVECGCTIAATETICGECGCEDDCSID